jgi:hypothetical protein
MIENHNKEEPVFARPPQNEEERNRAFEQYKLLVESINKSNEVREASNNFWTTVNALGLSAIAYIRDTQSLATCHKPLVLWVMVSVGMVLCLSWLGYLRTIKQTVEVRNNLLFELEKYMPFKIFTHSITAMKRDEGKGSLTFKEMMVPGLFFIGYLAFSVLLYFFPTEVLESTPR